MKSTKGDAVTPSFHIHRIFQKLNAAPAEVQMELIG